MVVVHKRLRAILYPLTLYACCGAASSAFIYTALNGDRGLRTKSEYKQKITALRADLDVLKAEHARWDHRIGLMRSEAIDEDMLQEQARSTIDALDPRDLVIFLKTPGRS